MLLEPKSVPVKKCSRHYASFFYLILNSVVPTRGINTRISNCILFSISQSALLFVCSGNCSDYCPTNIGITLRIHLRFSPRVIRTLQKSFSQHIAAVRQDNLSTGSTLFNIILNHIKEGKDFITFKMLLDEYL